MTGACRPTPPECIAEVILSYQPEFDWPGKERGHWLSRPKDIDRWKRDMARAVWDALLTEGWLDDPYEGDAQGGPCLVVPLAADEDKDNKEDYEGGVNWP